MKGRRAATLCLALVAGEVLALGGMVAFAWSRGSGAARVAEANREIARELRLTSLALWSEPRYARHPAEADLFAPFGDHPAAIEHFPAGSIVPPPLVARDVDGRR